MLKFLANQIKQAQESKISIHEIHENAVIEMERKYGPEQTPLCIHTLKKKLFMPIKRKQIQQSNIIHYANRSLLFPSVCPTGQVKVAFKKLTSTQDQVGNVK